MAEETVTEPEEVAATEVVEPSPLVELSGYLADVFGDRVRDIRVDTDELVILVDPSQLFGVVSFLRDDQNCLFTQLIDICGVDYPAEDPRFEIVYNFLGMKHNHRARVKLRTSDDQPVPSIVGIHPSAGWFERECWDLYGVFFDGNPDLRRILTDYGFEGHPLRKDFPLTGFVELRYDEAQKRVVYEPVKLTQDFRSFDFLSPWEGMTDIMLPGDEKAVQPKFNPTDSASDKGGNAT
ncbi:MAG: NADH-quinone oxidoreductase subunit C [Pseudomonadota bacterium]